MRKSALAAILATPILLAGCGGGGSGTDQVIRVATVPDKVAHCILENDHGSDGLYATPGSIAVRRSSAPLVVSCRTMDGWSGATVMESRKGSYADPASVGALTLLTTVSVSDPSTQTERYRSYASEVVVRLEKEASRGR